MPVIIAMNKNLLTDGYVQSYQYDDGGGGGGGGQVVKLPPGQRQIP